MSRPLITVAIPTRNRPEYLRQSLRSVLDQTYSDMKVLVLDNCSDQEFKIQKIVEEFKDDRVLYVCHPQNLGIIGNWNKAIELCTTKYLSIFHDDDVMLPEFINKSVAALEANPTVGMTYTHANKVNPNLEFISLWSDLVPNVGLIKGREYIEFTIEHGCCISIAPTVVVRMQAYQRVGNYQEELCFNSFDFNMWIRIAQQFDIYFIDKVLVNYRLHEKQMSQTYWWSDDKAKGRLATMLELMKAISIVQTYPKAKTKWLSKKLFEYTKYAAEYSKQLVPGL